MDKELEKKLKRVVRLIPLVPNNCFISGKCEFNFNYLNFFKSLIKNIFKKWVQEVNLKSILFGFYLHKIYQ